jgi:hypothetical protein
VRFILVQLLVPDTQFPGLVAEATEGARKVCVAVDEAEERDELKGWHKLEPGGHQEKPLSKIPRQLAAIVHNDP